MAFFIYILILNNCIFFLTDYSWEDVHGSMGPVEKDAATAEVLSAGNSDECNAAMKTTLEDD